MEQGGRRKRRWRDDRSRSQRCVVRCTGLDAGSEGRKRPSVQVATRKGQETDSLLQSLQWNAALLTP